MSYKCQICEQPNPIGSHRRVHIIYRERTEKVFIGIGYEERTRKEIAKEIPVCTDCYLELADKTYEQVVAERQPKKSYPKALRKTFKEVQEVTPEAKPLVFKRSK